MADNNMEYGRYFDSKVRRRDVDYSESNDAYHHGVVIPSPPHKVSKATTLSTPNPQLKPSSSLQQRNNSMSSNDDTKTSNSTSYSKTPVGSIRKTAPFVPNSTSPPTNKAYKGLRHFSLMVCKKVEEKGTTSYNEVADELVRQILDDRYNIAHANDNTDDTTEDAAGTSTTTATPSPRKQHQPSKFDEKNIRRRVYDALNVLMAMNIIIKDKKAIMWRGLPTSLASATMTLPDGSINMQPPKPVETLQTVQNDIQTRTKNVQKKREMMHELVLQHVCFRNLVERNYQREQQLQKEKESAANDAAIALKNQGRASTSPFSDTSEQNAKVNSSSSSSSIGTTTNTQTSSKSKQQQQRAQQEEQNRKKKKQQKLLLDNKIPLPFIVINTNENAVIKCNMSRDLTEVMFDFTMPFEINDDNSILKRLHLYVTYTTCRL